MKHIKLHSHPMMEEKKGIDERHVIIDKDAYFAIKELGKELLKIIVSGEKLGGNRILFF